MKTIKEIADNLGVSKQTIRNEIDRQGLRQGLQQTAKGLYLDDEQESLVAKAIQERQTENGLHVYQKTEKPQSEKGFAGLRSFYERALQEKNEQIERYQNQIESLTKSIETQNESIKNLIASNDNLTAALESALTSIQGAQALHYGTMQGIETKEDETIIEPQETVQDETAGEQRSGEEAARNGKNEPRTNRENEQPMNNENRSDPNEQGTNRGENEQRKNNEPPKKTFWQRLFGK